MIEIKSSKAGKTESYCQGCDTRENITVIKIGVDAKAYIQHYTQFRLCPKHLKGFRNKFEKFLRGRAMTQKQREESIKKWCRFVDEVIDENEKSERPSEWYGGRCSFCYACGSVCTKCPLSRTQFEDFPICDTDEVSHYSLARNAFDTENWETALHHGLIVLEGVMTL